MLGVVCGMAAEVRALGGWARDARLRVTVSGARPDRAEAAARRLVAEGCTALLSWGVAGGLDPALRPGALILAGEIVEAAGPCRPLDADLHARLARVPGATGGQRLLGHDTAVLTAAEKSLLGARSGAVAVDMETHRIARVAAEAGIPAAAVRAVGDPAGRDLPALAADALDLEGRPRIGAVALGLLRRPGDLGALLRVKRDTDAALAALAAAADDVLTVLVR